MCRSSSRRVNDSTWGDRLSGLVSEDECAVVVPLRHFDGREDRGGGMLAKLRIDRTECRVGVRHDLICGQGDQCAAAHGVMRDDRGHLPVVVGESRRDLARRDHEPSGRVQDQLDRLASWRLVNKARRMLSASSMSMYRTSGKPKNDIDSCRWIRVIIVEPRFFASASRWPADVPRAHSAAPPAAARRG
jgi:hypothetical protein